MLKEKITTVLFDLDGTLLPMEMEDFINAYFGLLAEKAAPYGYPPKELVAAVWKGTKAMMRNDGAMKNSDRFWQVFADALGQEVLALRPVFDEFYANEFDRVKNAVGRNPLARKLIDGLKGKGYDLILATNPLFPAVGVKTRLSWIDLTPEDFSEVTTYENYSYCKPHPGYFREILEKTGKRPEECVMVGNDTAEDLAARELGIDVCLVTDCLIDGGGVDLSTVEHGTFAELSALLGIE